MQKVTQLFPFFSRSTVSTSCSLNIRTRQRIFLRAGPFPKRGHPLHRKQSIRVGLRSHIGRKNSGGWIRHCSLAFEQTTGYLHDPHQGPVKSKVPWVQRRVQRCRIGHWRRDHKSISFVSYYDHGNFEEYVVSRLRGYARSRLGHFRWGALYAWLGERSCMGRDSNSVAWQCSLRFSFGNHSKCPSILWMGVLFT